MVGLVVAQHDLSWEISIYGFSSDSEDSSSKVNCFSYEGGQLFVEHVVGIPFSEAEQEPTY